MPGLMALGRAGRLGARCAALKPNLARLCLNTLGPRHQNSPLIFVPLFSSLFRPELHSFARITPPTHLFSSTANNEQGRAFRSFPFFSPSLPGTSSSPSETTPRPALRQRLIFNPLLPPASPSSLGLLQQRPHRPILSLVRPLGLVTSKGCLQGRQAACALLYGRCAVLLPYNSPRTMPVSALHSSPPPPRPFPPPAAGASAAVSPPPTIPPSTPSSTPSCATHSPPAKRRISAKRLRQAIISHPISKLIKLELSTLVVITTAGGYLLTGGSPLEVSFWGAITGTFLCASSASIWNQLDEVEYDGQMARTMQRPLVTKRISVSEAKKLRLLTGLGGCGLLLLTTSHITAALGAATIWLYACVYTPMKRKTKWNTEVGAVVGAIPPVMGWAAVNGLDALVHTEALFLAAYLFVWQMSHFMVITWRRREEYYKAGYRMRSRDDSKGLTVQYGYAWALASLPFPAVATALGFTSPSFLFLGTLPHLYLIYHYKGFLEASLRSLKQPAAGNKKAGCGSDAAAVKAFKAGFLSLLSFGALMVLCMLIQEDRFEKISDWTLRAYKKGHAVCLFFFHMDAFKFLHSQSGSDSGGSDGKNTTLATEHSILSGKQAKTGEAGKGEGKADEGKRTREKSFMERLFCFNLALPSSQNLSTSASSSPHPAAASAAATAAESAVSHSQQPGLGNNGKTNL